MIAEIITAKNVAIDVKLKIIPISQITDPEMIAKMAACFLGALINNAAIVGMNKAAIEIS